MISNLTHRMQGGGRKAIRKPLIFFSMLMLLTNVSAAFADITVTPVTWNVIGLDSNKVTVGPNVFPVGVRVCNNSASEISGLKTDFNWINPSSTYINLEDPAVEVLNVPAIQAGSCQDMFYQVVVTRDKAAYYQKRGYQIAVLDGNNGDAQLAITPTNRELFVEYLISQNRNTVSGVTVNGAAIPAGGFDANVGQTLTIKLSGATATQGYEQFEQFLTLNSSIFRVNSVQSTYTANAGTDLLATSKIYADGCEWVNDTTSPKYRNCIGTGKYGGKTTLTYNITIIGGAGTSQSLQALLYDFSGSSYHYNSDFSAVAGIINIGNAYVPQADLEIVKTASSATADTTNPFDFILTVTNNGTDPATGVVVIDDIPLCYSPQGNPNNWVKTKGSVTAPGQLVTWTVGPLAVNETAVLTIPVKARNTGTQGCSSYLNTATVSGDQNDPEPNNNTSSKAIDVVTSPVADVAVSKTASPLNPKVGDTVTFVITATNLGPDIAANVNVADALPNGFTPTGTPVASAGTTYNGTTWSIGNLDVGEVNEKTLTLQGIVKATGVFNNVATISTSTAENDSSNNTANAIAQPTFLSITKVADDAFVLATGGNATGGYTLSVTKSGNPASLGTVTVQDVAPTGMLITSMSGTGWTCTLATATCLRTDTVGQPTTYPQIVVGVSLTGITADTTFDNYASASAGNSWGETTAPITVTTTPNADLKILKTGPATVASGGGLSYQLQVTNLGPSDTNGALVKDVAVANFTVTGVTCQNATGGAACPGGTLQVADLQGGGIAIPTLPHGGDLFFTVTGTAATGPASITNTGTVTAPAGVVDPVPANNTSTAGTTAISDPSSPPLLGIVKDHVADGQAGGTGVFTITVSNSGGQSTSGLVTVTDAAPTGMTVSSMEGTDWVCTGLSCTRSDALASGQSYPVITVTVSIADNAPSPLVNVASAQGGGDTTGPHQATSSMNITPLPPVPPVYTLGLVKSQPVGQVVVGSTVTYMVTATNTGNATQTNVVVTDNKITPSSETCAIVAPGGTCVLTGTYVVSQADASAGKVVNTGSVTSSQVAVPVQDMVETPVQRQVPPNPIPTLGEWGQMIMMLLMILSVGYYSRRMLRR